MGRSQKKKIVYSLSGKMGKKYGNFFKVSFPLVKVTFPLTVSGTGLSFQELIARDWPLASETGS